MNGCLFRYADQVSINDEVLVPGFSGMTPTNVTAVSRSLMEGKSHTIHCKISHL